MKSVLTKFMWAVALVAAFTPSWAKQVDTIESEGVYVVAEKGFVKVGSYNYDSNFVDFNHLHEINSVKRADQNLKLIVYKKDFNPSSITLELRPIATTVDVRQVDFDAKPGAKANTYELTLDKPVKDGVMLHVRAGDFFRNYGVIMLGETQAELVKYFSQKDLPSAYTVKQYLDDARKAFPNNAELKKLSTYWDKAGKDDKDKQMYAYVEENWQEYQKAEKLAAKAHFLNEMLGWINGYLNDYPDGLKVSEAKQRKKHAEEKLKEIEKQI